MRSESRILRLLELAIKESRKSSYKHRVGCLITQGNRIIAKGYNDVSYKSTGVLKYSEWKESRHAERDATSKLDRDEIKGSVVYIAREFKDGSYALAAPCSCCLSLLNDMKVKRIIFSIPEEPYWAEIKL